jgi:hypothetical protein
MFRSLNIFDSEPGCSLGSLLVVGADLFREKSTVGWLLVADLF